MHTSCNMVRKNSVFRRVGYVLYRFLADIRYDGNVRTRGQNPIIPKHSEASMTNIKKLDDMGQTYLRHSNFRSKLYFLC